VSEGDVVALRRGLLLIIVGLLLVLFDMRIQRWDLLPDTLGAILSVLGARRVMALLGDAGPSRYLRTAFMAFLGVAVFMLPDIWRSPAPGLLPEVGWGSVPDAVMWAGGFVSELGAVLSLSLAAKSWASSIGDESLAHLARITYHLVWVSVTSLVFALPASMGEGWWFAGLFALVALGLGVLGLIARLLLLYCLVRMRRSASTMAEVIVQ
jgi:hypothetical protein